MTELPLKLGQADFVQMGVLAAFMLFPEKGEEPLRRKCIQLFSAEWVIDRLEAGEMLAPHHVIAAIKSAQDGFSADEFGRFLREREWLGMSAGLHLYNSTIAASRGEPKAMERSLQKIYKAKTGRSNSNSKHINDQWKRYRPASPFWAAHIWMYPERAGIPCERRDVAKFIQSADAFRRLGEETKASNGKPILAAGAAFSVPKELSAKDKMVIAPIPV